MPLTTTLVSFIALSNGWIAPQGPTVLLPKSALTELATRVSGTSARASASPNGIKVTMEPAVGADPWSSTLHAASRAPIKKGDVVQIVTRLRSTTRTQVSFHYELTNAPNTKFISSVQRPGPGWQTVKLAGVSPQDFAPGQVRLAVFLAHGKGELEISELEVLNHGPGDPKNFRSPVDIFGGEPNPDSWRAEANASIEKFRKGGLAIKVVDAAGKPIPNAIVRVEQKKHQFRFGTAGPASMLNARTDDGDRYRAVVEEYFNTFTFENDLKWNQLGEPNYEAVEEAVEWLYERGYKIRGHCLVWGSERNLPQGLLDQPNDQLLSTLRERVEKPIKRFEDFIYVWDVVNEAVTENQLWNRLGWNTFHDTFRWAKVANPKIFSCYNDYNWTEENQVGSGHRLRAIKIVEDAIKKGVPIDMIGLQCHVGVPLTPVKRVLEIVNRIAAWNRPIEITEFDIGGMDDERAKADYLEDYLTAMFSHPKVDAFILWGFWEGAHWRANEGAAMFKRDWTPTPSAQRWKELVKGKWWTNAVKRTDANGTTQLRAFYGRHEVFVEANGKKMLEMVETPKGRDMTVTLVVR